MSEKVRIEILASEAIKILESLAFDNFEQNEKLMRKIISQLNIPLNDQDRIMDRLEYFIKALIKVKGDGS